MRIGADFGPARAAREVGSERGGRPLAQVRLRPHNAALGRGADNVSPRVGAALIVSAWGSGMPDFLVIGVQKGGTTWLHQQLEQHPDLWFPFVKEVHFLDKRFLEPQLLERARRHPLVFDGLSFVRTTRQRMLLGQNWRGGRRAGDGEGIDYLRRLIDREKFMTDEWYDVLFSPAPAGRRTGEVTPLYCGIGEAGIRYLEERFPAVRLIYIIRDPVERAISSMRMFARRTEVNLHNPRQLRSFANRCLNSSGFLARGDYREQIPLWDRQFGNQVLYLPFGDIRSEPAALLRRVESFIGVRHLEQYPELHRPVHSSFKSAPIPSEITARFADISRDQYEFLNGRFGAEFVARIR